MYTKKNKSVSSQKLGWALNLIKSNVLFPLICLSKSTYLRRVQKIAVYIVVQDRRNLLGRHYFLSLVQTLMKVL